MPDPNRMDAASRQSQPPMEKIETTGPKLLVQNAAKYQNRVAMREKYKGIWQEVTWKTYQEKVKWLSLGLLELGIERDIHASILGENCPEWIFADLAIQTLGAVSVGIYPSNSEDQVKYILEHSMSHAVFVGDQEQTDKVLAIRAGLPLLKYIIVFDMKGLRGYDDPMIISYDHVEELGQKKDRQDDAIFFQLVEKTKAEDVAFIVYTSGTTGPPKGAMITHRSNIHQIKYGLQPVLKFSEDDSILSYLPLCHILERNLSMALPLVFGFTINFAESIETVPQNIQEISPTFFAAVPRILEKLHSAVQIKLEDTTRFKKLIYDFFKAVGIKASALKMRGKKLPFFLLAAYGIGYLCSFRPVRDKMGLLNCRMIMSGGAPIAPEVLSFFRSLGVNTVELYGMTETSGGGAGPHHEIKDGSVGEPLGSQEFRLADDGEILIKGDGVFAGYYRDDAATNEAISDGWFHTGDVGRLDEDGHLYIVDRKKDIIITSGGKNISPSEIENLLKCCPYIKEAVVIGDGKKYLTSLIQIDYENTGNWAQNNKIPYTTYKNLAQNNAVTELIKEEIYQVNEKLAQVETIKKFKILEKELDQDDEELTATQKVKRKTISQRFKREIDEMYGSAG